MVSWLGWRLLRWLCALCAWGRLEPKIAQEGCYMLQALKAREARITTAKLLRQQFENLGCFAAEDGYCILP